MLLSVIGPDDPAVVDSNLSPEAVSDSAETTAGIPVTVDVLANDSDPDGDFLTIAAAGAANHGSVEVRPADSGLWDYYQFDQQYAGQYGDSLSFNDWYSDSFGGDPAQLSDVALYTPDAGFSGTDTFSYTVADTSDLSSTATVAVNVADTSGPEFAQSSYAFEVPIDSTDGTIVGSVAATAEDNVDIDYALDGASAFFVTDTGEVVLDYAYELQYIGVGSSQTFTVVASDGIQNSLANVTITVVPGISIDEEPPPIDDLPDDYMDDLEELSDDPDYSGEDYYDMLDDSPIGDYIDPYADEIIDGYDDANETEEQYVDDYVDQYADQTPDDPNQATTSADPVDNTSSDDASGESELPFGWTPFQFPSNVVFSDSQLPAETAVDDLMLLQPTGTDTFQTTTSTVADPLVEAVDSELGQGTSTTDTSSETTLEQEYLSPTEWTVTQTVTNQFSAKEELAATEGSGVSGDDAEPSDQDGLETDREGSSTYSIAVINGTKTVVTYSVTDTFTFQTGSMPESVGADDNGTWVVPDTWQDAANIPGQTEDETTDSEHSGGEEEGSLSGDGSTGDEPVDTPPGDSGDQPPDAADDSSTSEDPAKMEDVWASIFGTPDDDSETSGSDDSGSDSADSHADDATDDQADSDSSGTTVPLGSGGSTTAGGSATVNGNGAGGTVYMATATYTVSLTTEAVTLSDGTPATTTSLSFSTSFFYISLSAGHFSVSSDDDADAGDDAVTAYAETDASDGMTESESYTASLTYMGFSTSSTQFSMSASMTTLPCGCVTDVSAGMSLDISSNSGNLETFTVSGQRQTSTNGVSAVFDGTNNVGLTSTETKGGSNHFQFGFSIGDADDDSANDDDDDTDTSVVPLGTSPAAAPDDDANSDDDDDSDADDSDDDGSGLTLAFGNSSFSRSSGRVTTNRTVGEDTANPNGSTSSWSEKEEGEATGRTSSSSSMSFSLDDGFEMGSDSNESSNSRFEKVSILDNFFQDNTTDYMGSYNGYKRTEYSKITETYTSSVDVTTSSNFGVGGNGVTSDSTFSANANGRAETDSIWKDRNWYVNPEGGIDSDLLVSGDSLNTHNVNIAGDQDTGLVKTVTTTTFSNTETNDNGLISIVIHDPPDVVNTTQLTEPAVPTNSIVAFTDDDDTDETDDEDSVLDSGEDADANSTPVGFQEIQDDKSEDDVQFTGDPADVKDMEAIWGRICGAAEKNEGVKDWLTLIATAKKPIVMKVIRQEADDGQPLVRFGSFPDEMLDLNDFEKIPKTGLGINQERVLFHEIAEQFMKQHYNQRDYRAAHANALKAESVIDGWIRTEVSQTINGQRLSTFMFSHPKHNAIYRQLISSTPKTGNVLIGPITRVK